MNGVLQLRLGASGRGGLLAIAAVAMIAAAVSGAIPARAADAVSPDAGPEAGRGAEGASGAEGGADVVYLAKLEPVEAVGLVEREGTGDGIEGAGMGDDARSLLTKAPARVVYALPEGAGWFAATVGVGRGAGRRASVQFEVRLDGERVCRSTVFRRGDEPADLRIKVGGAKTLTLMVNEADRGGRGDRASWREARLVGAAPAGPMDKRIVRDASVQRELYFEAEIEGAADRRPYLLSLPKPAGRMRAEAEAEGRRWPMLVFLHGIVEGGDDHRNLYIEAIPLYLRDRPDYVQRRGYVFLCPAAPWKTRFRREDVASFVIELVEHVRRRYPVDASRIYLTGLSDGAIGAWHIAAARPDLFAAVAPTAGREGPIEAVGEGLEGVPAWIVAGGRDRARVVDSIGMARAYAEAGAPFNLRIEPHRGHVIWDTVYLSDDIYAWLNQWRREGGEGGGRVARRVGAGVEPEGAGAEAEAQVAALEHLARAMEAYAEGRPVEMARRLGVLESRYAETIAGRVGRRQRASLEENRRVAERLKEAADEASAREMLSIALDHRRVGRTDDATRLLEQVVETWPLTEAAEEAAELMEAGGAPRR